jgi:hypothetical protein
LGSSLEIRQGAGSGLPPTEWKDIPVRRIAPLIQSAYCGTQWAVFEPNGEPLWALRVRLQTSVGPEGPLQTLGVATDPHAAGAILESWLEAFIATERDASGGDGA